MILPQIPTKDEDFLRSAAALILGGSHVATSTAERLAKNGVDAKRLGLLLMARGRDAGVDKFKFKLIDADPETPENFGVLVRSAQPPKPRHDGRTTGPLARL